MKTHSNYTELRNLCTSITTCNTLAVQRVIAPDSAGVSFAELRATVTPLGDFLAILGTGEEVILRLISHYSRFQLFCSFSPMKLWDCFVSLFVFFKFITYLNLHRHHLDLSVIHFHWDTVKFHAILFSESSSNPESHYPPPQIQSVFQMYRALVLLISSFLPCALHNMWHCAFLCCQYSTRPDLSAIVEHP